MDDLIPMSLPEKCGDRGYEIWDTRRGYVGDDVGAVREPPLQIHSDKLRYLV